MTTNYQKQTLRTPLLAARSVCTEDDLITARPGVVRSKEDRNILTQKNLKPALAGLDRDARRVYSFQPDILRGILLPPPIQSHPRPATWAEILAVETAPLFPHTV